MSVCIIGGSKNEQESLIDHIKKNYKIMHKDSQIIRIEIYDLQKKDQWNNRAENILKNKYGLIVVLTKDFNLIPQEYIDHFNELYCKLPMSYYDNNDATIDKIYHLYAPKVTIREFGFIRKLRNSEWLKIDKVNDDYEKIYC